MMPHPTELGKSFHTMEDGSEKPIGFASLTLTAAEKGYSQLDKEGSAIVFAVKPFHQYLWLGFHNPERPQTTDDFVEFNKMHSTADRQCHRFSNGTTSKRDGLSLSQRQRDRLSPRWRETGKYFCGLGGDG